MKWVTRKYFSQLSRRQQFSRLHRRQASLQVTKIDNEQILQCNSGNNANSNEIRQNDGIEQNDVEQVEINTLIDVDNENINDENNTLDQEVHCGEANGNNVISNVDSIRTDTLTNFISLLRQSFLDMDVNHIQINAILRVLRTHKCYHALPKDSRTLLQTGRNKINFLPIEPGVYWHIGFVRILQKHLLYYDIIPSELELEISTDGLSLSKNDQNQFWPIQYRVLNIPGFKPLIAGIYKGPTKPWNVTMFFEAFLAEVSKVQREGGITMNNRCIPVIFKRFVGDAPARALVLNHKGHNASHPCSKCKVIGFRYDNRVMVYIGVDHEKRSNTDYIAEEDEYHHKGRSPLTDLSIPPVTGVPFEIMHLVYLGVTKRLMEAWFNGKFGVQSKVKKSAFDEVSSRYLKLLNTCPKEFARRPRSLVKFHNFKATEFRHFLLYASATILTGVLTDEYYYHFLLLYVTMRILVSPRFLVKYLKIADSAIKTFVEYAHHLYSPAFVSYNVHSLQHLPDDAREFGPLENCSAFIYENNMPLFKKKIRNHPRPLEQFANRLKENNDIQHMPKTKNTFGNERVSLVHTDGPVPGNIDNYQQYKKYESAHFLLELDNSNSICKLEDESICKIRNIISMDTMVFFVVQRFQKMEDFFEKPIKSSSVGVYRCKDLSENIELITSNSINAKCYIMPSWNVSFIFNEESIVNDDEYIVSTIIHTDK